MHVLCCTNTVELRIIIMWSNNETSNELFFVPAVALLLGPNTSNLIHFSCQHSCYQHLVAITAWLMDGTPLGHSNQTITTTTTTTSNSRCSSGEESATEMLHVRAMSLPYSFTVQCIVVHLCVPENSADDSCRPRAYYSQQIQAYIGSKGK